MPRNNTKNQPSLERVFKKYADKISADIRQELGTKIDDFKEETRLNFENVRENFRTDIKAVKTELKGDIAGLRDEMGGLRGELSELRGEMGDLREEVGEVRRIADLTFEKVGEIATDVEIIKETVKDHEVRLQRVEAKAS